MSLTLDAVKNFVRSARNAKAKSANSADNLPKTDKREYTTEITGVLYLKLSSGSYKACDESESNAIRFLALSNGTRIAAHRVDELCVIEITKNTTVSGTTTSTKHLVVKGKAQLERFDIDGVSIVLSIVPDADQDDVE